MPSKILGVIRSDIIAEISEVRPLDSLEYDNYKKAVSTLNIIKNNLNLLQAVYFNFKDYEHALSYYLNEFAKNRNMDENIMDSISLQLNRLISNYLSSIRLLLDHSEYDLKKRYGKKSEIVNDFKNVCSNAYDTSFSYRFLYKLRNYVQHCGMPIGQISFISTVDDYDSNKTHTILELKFNRDDLLSKFDWKFLKEDIKKLPPKFNINPFIYEMNDYIVEIIFSIISNELNDGIQAYEYLTKLTDETKHLDGVPFIFDAENLSNDGGNLNMEWFPFRLMEIVAKFENNSPHSKSDVFDTKKTTSPSTTVLKDKTVRKRNLNKGNNGILYYLPENYQKCPKCNGPFGYYYENNNDITGKRYTAEYFACLRCKGIIK